MPARLFFWNLIFQTEIIEQRFRAGVVHHHDQQPYEDRNPAQHEKELFPSNMLAKSHLLISVTFSSTTPGYNSVGIAPQF